MKIAVIDNGVDDKLVDCSQSVDFSDGEKDLPETEDVEKYGHGTICAAIIKKYAPDAEIVNLKGMSTSEKHCKIEYIIKAISYCIQHNIKLISLSMGTRSIVETALLYNSIKEAVCNNTIIVAPGSRNLKVYPAAFDNVVYVDINDLVRDGSNKFYIEKCNNGLIAIIASGKQEIGFKTGESYITPNYSSFAVPVIVAVLFNLLKRYADPSIAKALLYGRAAGYLNQII